MSHTEGRESDGTYFFCVKDPQGDGTEQTMQALYNAAKMLAGKPESCAKSWEQFEAEGYRIVTIRLVEVQI